VARDLCDEESGRGRPVAFRSHGSGIAPVRRSNRLVRAIEMDIVPRLVQAHRARQIPDVSDPVRAGGGLGDVQVREFTRLLIAADSARAFRRIEQLRADGATPEGLLLDLFAPAARRLGCLWEEDLCDFTEVTVGLWRLELASRELSREAL